MLNSNERLDRINRYLAQYVTQINLGNDVGLFDGAKMLELFAQEVCRIWFCQEFNNLNLIQNDYPYVDLVSYDKKIYVQVTTAKDLNTKIRETLKKISESTEPVFQEIRNLYFFVHEVPVDINIINRIGKNRIGSIDFDAGTHLITAQKIYEKAQNDFDFQKKLYALVLKDSMQFAVQERFFRDTLERSKIKIREIDGLLHGEYKIPRDELIDKIFQEDCHFIMISGEPGVGKSTVGKMLVENEGLFLYARADELTECGSLQDLWRVDLNNLLFLLGDRVLYFFIDALEFIADGSINGKTNLRQLYEIATEYPNAYVVSSCRTSDLNSFPDLLTEYRIVNLRVEKLTDTELGEIGKRYPIVRDMMGIQAYRQIILIPFFLNMIISNLNDIADVRDENEFRRKIWRDVIYLGKNFPEGIKSTDIISTVRKIAFERAKNYLSGINEDEIDRTIADILLSNGVITIREHKVRLKYDIFEDICFEIKFDDLFEVCHRNYAQFFQELESFGTCCYRRYQIWLEHKLFDKSQRNRYVGKLLLDDRGIIPNIWIEQTIIGIIRSRYSSEFIRENEQQLFDTGLYWQIILTLNLHGFEISGRKLPDGEPYCFIHPIDSCRGEMIEFAWKHKLIRVSELTSSLVLLISDYSQQESGIREETAKKAVEILWVYLQKLWSTIGNTDSGAVMWLLKPLYQLAKYAKEKICNFWEDIRSAYLRDDRSIKHRLAEKILEETVFFPTNQLAECMPEKLCQLADTYWLETPKRDIDVEGCFLPKEEKFFYNPFQLNRKAREYKNKVVSPDASGFLKTLLAQSFWCGLDWCISVINTHVERYVQLFPDSVEKVVIHFFDGEIRQYYGNLNFWSVCAKNSNVPALLGDIIDLLVKQAETYLNNDKEPLAARLEFAECLKQTIVSKANNIMLLRVIKDLGLQFLKLIPGYALDLASDMNIIRWDIRFYASTHPDGTIKRLEQEILDAVQIPFLPERYDVSDTGSLMDYVLIMQILKDSSMTGKIQGMLDNLYLGNGNNLEDKILINKMDLRCYDDIMESADKRILIPQFGHVIEEIKEERGDTWAGKEKEEKEFDCLTKEIAAAFADGNLTLPFCLEKLSKLKEENFDLILTPQISSLKIALIAFSLQQEELAPAKRSELCDYWITGINSLFDFQSFVFDKEACSILFAQTENELLPETAIQLRLLILQLITKNHYSGLLMNIADVLWRYLKGNRNLAKGLFVAVTGLVRSNDGFPIDEKCPVEAVQLFLHEKDPPDDVELNFTECDPSRLSSVVRCGLELRNEPFRETICFLLRLLLQAWNGEPQRDHENLLDVEKNLKAYFGEKIREMEEAEDITDLLFDETMISLFSDKSVSFYTDIFSWIHVLYFDSHKKPEIRSKCMHLIAKLETYVHLVPDEALQKALEKVFFLEPWRFSSTEQKKLITSYSGWDKQFLNRLWSRYGSDHVHEFLQMLESMKIKELLPEVLITINAIMEKCGQDPGKFVTLLHYNYITLNRIITLADVYYRDEIRLYDELREAYDGLLTLLAKFNFREAAVLLDEFRIH